MENTISENALRQVLNASRDRRNRKAERSRFFDEVLNRMFFWKRPEHKIKE